VWSPPALDARILTQRACFLVPNLQDADHEALSAYYDPTAPVGVGIKTPRHRMHEGESIVDVFEQFLNDPESSQPDRVPNVAMITIPYRRKKPMRDLLNTLGINVARIYPDLEGYAASFPLC
jgi:hypothetical protein